MSEPGTKIQVNLGPNGPLVNFYATDGDELRQLLADYADAAQDVVDTAQLYIALRSLGSTPVGNQVKAVEKAAPAASQGLPEGVTQQYCEHQGQETPMKFMEGISKTTGNPYRMFVCPFDDKSHKTKFVPRGR